MRVGACAFCSACASVLTLINSTPDTWPLIMRLTAFVPPPPTPTTLIAACGIPSGPIRLPPLRSGSRNGRMLSTLYLLAPSWQQLAEPALQPAHAFPFGQGAERRLNVLSMICSPLQKSNGCRVGGPHDRIGQPDGAGGDTDPRGDTQDVTRHLAEILQLPGPAHQNHPRR